MRFFIYKNSLLATLCSLLGAGIAALSVIKLVEELSIANLLIAVPGIAICIGLNVLAANISEKKAQKKRAKAKAANVAASYYAASKVAEAKSQQAANTAQAASVSYSADAEQKQPVKKSAVFAGVFFLLAAAIGLWACNSLSMVYSTLRLHSTLNSEQIVLVGASVLMAIAAFRTRHTQKVSVLFVIGFLGLTLASVDVALCTWRDYGFGGYIGAMGIHYIAIFAPLVSAISYFLMTLFALFSLGGIKKHMGGLVKWLWWLPVLALIAANVKWFDDNFVANAFIRMTNPRWIGLKNTYREVLEAIARGMLILGAFLSGICFRKICKKPLAACVSSAPQAAPRYEYQNAPQNAPQSAPQSVYTPPAQEIPVQPQPQPQPQYTAPEAPKAAPAVQVTPQEIEKEMLAYKDLFECGILTREECEEKIRELTQKYYGG